MQKSHPALSWTQKLQYTQFVRESEHSAPWHLPSSLTPSLVHIESQVPCTMLVPPGEGEKGGGWTVAC